MRHRQHSRDTWIILGVLGFSAVVLVVVLAQRYPLYAVGGVAGLLVLRSIGAKGLTRGFMRIALRFAPIAGLGFVLIAIAQAAVPVITSLAIPVMLVIAAIVAMRIVDARESARPTFAAQQSAVGPWSWFSQSARAGLARLQSRTAFLSLSRIRGATETSVSRRDTAFPRAAGTGNGNETGRVQEPASTGPH
jgi:hypothetical protein